MKRLLLGSVAAVALAGAAHSQGMSGGYNQNLAGTCASGQPCAGLASLSVNPQNATYTVGSGGNFATLNAAMAALNPQFLTTGSSITLTLLDGAITEPSPVYIGNPFGNKIQIVGQHSYTFTVSSIQSSSGATGSWSYVLNLSAAPTNIAVGDYLTLSALTGGTNPVYAAGVWPVTNVDTANNRVTIATTSRTPTAAAGAVTGTAIDMKSTLKFAGTDGIRVWDGATGINLGGFNIVGNNTAGTNGLSVQDVGRTNVYNLLSVANFGFANFLTLYSAEINGAGALVSSGATQWGFISANGGTIDAPNLVATGNGGVGAQAVNGGTLTAGLGVVFSGNGSDGGGSNAGGLLWTSGTAISTGNVGAGFNTKAEGLLQLQGAVTSTNNGATDQQQFYAPAGIAALGTSTFGFTANQCPGFVACFNGNIRTVGTMIQLGNTTSSTAGVLVQSNAKAQIDFQDQTGATKWEMGHKGSTGSYDYQLYNDTQGVDAIAVSAATSNVTLAGTVKPGSVVVGGTNACSQAGAKAWVTDATVAFSTSTRGGNITGGGSNAVPAYCDGSKWDFD